MTDHDQRVQAAFDAREEARKASAAHDRMVHVEADAARNAVLAKHRETTRALNDAYLAADRAYEAAQEAAPPHPWVGKRVWKNERRRRDDWQRRYEDVRIEGVVEMMTTKTELPGTGFRYGGPTLGEPIVRLTKADGSLGKKIDPRISGWRLVEETE